MAGREKYNLSNDMCGVCYNNPNVNDINNFHDSKYISMG